MITCEHAVEWVYDFLDGELEAEEMEHIREHLEMCRRCYPYFNFERIFLDHVRSHGRSEESKPELADKVLQLIRELETGEV